VNECGDVGRSRGRGRGCGVEGGRRRVCDEWAAEPASRGEEKRGAHCSTTTARGSRQMRAAGTAQCDNVLGEIEGEGERSDAEVTPQSSSVLSPRAASRSPQSTIYHPPSTTTPRCNARELEPSCLAAISLVLPNSQFKPRLPRPAPFTLDIRVFL